MSLKKIAADALALSPLCSNRERVKKEWVLSNSPLTITAIDSRGAVGNNGEPYTIVFFTFEEDDGVYFSTSTRQANALYDAWMDEYGGEAEALAAAIKEEKVRVKFHLVGTKKGNPMLAIDFE